MSSAGVIAHCLTPVTGTWIAGPVAVNGALGGSQNYYKKTYDIQDWTGPALSLPLGRTGMTGASAANRAFFMMFTGQNAAVSFDGANTWQTTNVVLPAVPVYYNGSVYVCGTYLSTDGITWSTIPNLSGTPAFTVARRYDGAIICAYQSTSRFEYTLDNGATWTVKDAPNEEGVYSLIVMPDAERINFGVGMYASPNIAQYFTDDLFENMISNGSNRYHGKYGCSRLVNKGYPNTVELSTDGGWSWDTVIGTATYNNEFNFLDFGENTWGLLSRVSSGSPQIHSVYRSVDGGETWDIGGTLYGSVNAIAYVGTRGNCDLYPAPDYAVFSNYRIFGGTPTTAHYIATHNWSSSDVIVSRDAQFIMNASTTANAVIYVYRRSPNGMGFELIPDVFGAYLGRNGGFAISYDSQYFVASRSGTNTFVVMRYVDGVFSELVTPGTPAIGITPFMHPSRHLMFWEEGTSIRAYTISGDTITQGSLTPTGMWYLSNVGFSPVDPDIMVIRTNVDQLQVYDISDPTVVLPRLANISGGSSSSGAYGLYFSADGSHIITVDLNYIYTRTWDKTTGTIGPAVLLHTFSSRALDSDLSKDHRYLVEGGDIAAPFITIHHLSADGASILSSYNPEGSSISQNNTVAWVDY